MRTLKLVRVSGPHGDETSSYRVDFPEGMTVKEFIETTLKENPGEWGTFSSSWSSSGKIAEYKYGKLIETGFETYNKFKDRKVKSVSANGGWSLMNYVIAVV